MKMSIKIWLLAILYQTIIFIMMKDAFSEYTVIIIPIELAGGLPGLFLFDLLVKLLKRSNDNIALKWVWIIIGGALAAFITSVITAMFFGDLVKEFLLGNHFIMWYAPISATMAILSLSLPVYRLLAENAINEESDNIFNNQK